MSAWDISIVVAYFLLLAGVALYSSRQAKDSSSFLVAGHRLGYGVTFACLSAVLLGGASTIGTTALGYRFGISGIWLVTMLGLGLALVGVLLIKKIRELEVLTVAELLASRFGPHVRVLSALVSSLYTMMVCATQVIAMGTILQTLASWDPIVSMVAVGVVVVAYTLVGGMWAITLTDFVQFLLIVGGIMFVMLPLCVSAAGGFDRIYTELPASYFDPTSIGIDTIVQYFLLYCLGAFVGQDLWQRYLTAKSVTVARRSGIAAGCFILLYALACAVIGMAAAVYMPGQDNAQLVFSQMTQQILPPGAFGLVLVAVLAVLMSTASGTLLASSSLLVNDVIKPLWHTLEKRSEKASSQEKDSIAGCSNANNLGDLKAHKQVPAAGDKLPIQEKRALQTNRRAIAAIGGVAIIVAVCLNDVLVALDISYAILSGSLFVPCMMALFWRRASMRAAIISIAASSVVVLGGLVIMGAQATIPIIWGIIVSAVLMYVISICDFRRTRHISCD